ERRDAEDHERSGLRARTTSRSLSRPARDATHPTCELAGISSPSSTDPRRSSRDPAARYAMPLLRPLLLASVGGRPYAPRVRLRVLGCAGGSAPSSQLSCYLLDDVLAVDAGALTTSLDFPAQRRVQDVLLTHGHLDHVWTLPLFLANRFGGKPVPCRIHGSS